SAAARPATERCCPPPPWPPPLWRAPLSPGYRPRASADCWASRPARAWLLRQELPPAPPRRPDRQRRRRTARVPVGPQGDDRFRRSNHAERSRGRRAEAATARDRPPPFPKRSPLRLRHL